MKKKVLFFSPHAVHDRSAMAGHQTFNFYLKSFANDSDFEISYVILHKNDFDYKTMHLQFNGCKDFSIRIPLFIRIYNFFHYNKGLKNLLSWYNPIYYFVSPLLLLNFIYAAKKIKNHYTPDVIVLEWTEMLFIYPQLRKIFPNSKFVSSEHDVTFIAIERKASLRMVKFAMAKKFKDLELSLLKNMNLVLLHNYLDAERLKQFDIQSEKLLVISPFYSNHLAIYKQKKYTNNILFYGAMGRPENIQAVSWFISNVFEPYQLYDKFTFTVVGAKGELLKNRYNYIPNLHFTGFVEDPSNYFEESLCMVAPIFQGAGIKVKVIEGMRAALPVLTTKIGMEGISATNGISFFLCDEPYQYYNVLLALLLNVNLAKSVGSNAMKLINQDFSFENSYKEYKQKILSLINSH
ncbi:MAG: glycosyltransferase [Hydrotalea sp. AMD]|uniref:glycosyltransferase n=1 Tax=Hydrotalea sp. AMD TaxID=2501297 RepID=UPI000944DB96|nr:glycosyltransferase [Hydrotalea sp. AMD]RWZ88329.1 MAG: glycosyltransferase [Hydrotalea sp. AMD]